MNSESRNLIKYSFLSCDKFWLLLEECKRLNTLATPVSIGANRCFVVGLVNGPKSLHVHTEKNYKHFLLTLNLIQLNYNLTVHGSLP
ncbi:Uncharacterised protein [Salmonella enterica]|nr:Uncharacterised protein [Salmonella enterica]